MNWSRRIRDVSDPMTPSCSPVIRSTRISGLSGSCKTNCSFVSGHAALGFWFIGFAWALGRRRYLWLGIGIGAVVGLGRNIQGNHYLSDVVFAFWMVYLCAVILAWRYELVIDETAAVENR